MKAVPFLAVWLGLVYQDYDFVMLGCIGIAYWVGYMEGETKCK